MIPKYPVYVISKGRSDCCLTARMFQQDNVPFSLVVEPQEVEAYAAKFGRECIKVLPFSNLGLGGIPARNWVWEHAKQLGHERHWILDDNIRNIHRRWQAMRIRCEAGLGLRVAEVFTDRYENIAISGLAYNMFVPDKAIFKPFFLNAHVYSCLLIRNDLPYRWRGRYNEDTDLCLQVLAGGLCTVLFNAYTIEKMPSMVMKGGNTAELYKGDGRLTMSRSLERVWPGVVTTKRRFNRPQHSVAYEWKKFDTPLKKKVVLPDEQITEADCSLRVLRPPKSTQIQGYVKKYEELYGGDESE